VRAPAKQWYLRPPPLRTCVSASAAVMFATAADCAADCVASPSVTEATTAAKAVSKDSSSRVPLSCRPRVTCRRERATIEPAQTGERRESGGEGAGGKMRD